MSRALVLLLLAAPCVLAEDVAPSAGVEAPPTPHRARLAAWRAGARPPAPVPATAVVKAASRSERAAPGRAAGARRGAVRPSVEIIWHAPGSND